MMSAQRLVVTQADGNRLVATVHRYQVDVDVNQQVAFGGAAIQRERFLVFRLAKLYQPVGPFGIVVVVALGIVLVENLLPDHALHFPFGHLPVQGIGDDDVYVVYAVSGEHVEDDLENALTNIRRSHRRERQADVVNRHGDAHPGFELSEQRITVMRVIECITNSRLTVR